MLQITLQCKLKIELHLEQLKKENPVQTEQCIKSRVPLKREKMRDNTMLPSNFSKIK